MKTAYGSRVWPSCVRCVTFTGCRRTFCWAAPPTGTARSIDSEMLYDGSTEKGSLRGSIMATLQKKLAVNTTGLLFDLLSRTNSREAITAAGDCLGATLYDLLRRLYRQSGGNEDLFATEAVDFDAGAVDAALLRSRGAYMRALTEADELPHLSSDALTTLPGIGQSAAQVIHNVDERAGK